MPLGAAIPFGRSLTYRFAFVGFWSVAAFTGVELPAPLNDWGVVKGFLLRHFRWWSDKSDIFNIDGTLTIGFTYPNYYMSEDYNSPQSPYWAMKSFVALGLPSTHTFWTAEEKPLPSEPRSLVQVIKPPMHIVCSTGSHHFLLSAGQFCPWPLKATEAKYGKYAYSSQFGFSVPTGPLLAQTAPDSTLALSKDGGDTWRVPWKVHRHSFGTVSLIQGGKSTETIPTLRSTWKPWKDAEIEVSTTLIPPCSPWPDWHVRIHEVINTSKSSDGLKILSLQGGFAVQGRKAKKGENLPYFRDSKVFSNQDTSFVEGILESVGVLVCSSAGASGIRPLQVDIESSAYSSAVDAVPELLKPDANTNLIWQRTLIPTLRGNTQPLSPGHKAIFVTGVFAISRSSGSEVSYDELDIGTRWEDVPVLVIDRSNRAGAETFIAISSI